MHLSAPSSQRACGGKRQMHSQEWLCHQCKPSNLACVERQDAGRKPQSPAESAAGALGYKLRMEITSRRLVISRPSRRAC